MIINNVGAKISTYGTNKFQATRMNFSFLNVGGQIGKVSNIAEEKSTVW